jgi:hypothetical protein
LAFQIEPDADQQILIGGDLPRFDPNAGDTASIGVKFGGLLASPPGSKTSQIRKKRLFVAGTMSDVGCGAGNARVADAQWS